jgi:hypothetical protein
MVGKPAAKGEEDEKNFFISLTVLFFSGPLCENLFCHLINRLLTDQAS